MKQRTDCTNRAGRTTRRGSSATIVVAIIVIAVLAGGGWLVFRGDSAEGAARTTRAASDLFEVTRGTFNVTIPASGELAAMRQVEIRNPLETRAIITFIVDEGDTVKEGDILVQFADEDIINSISESELSVMAAENSLASAKNALVIQESSNTSNLSQAKIDLEIAEIAFEQWEKGDDVANQETLMLSVATAEKNADRLRKKYEESIDLSENGFISKDERDRDEISMMEANANLTNAERELEVYRDYQRIRDELVNQSAIDRSKEELQRVKTQNVAEIERSEAAVIARRGELDNRQTRLDFWKDQLERSVIHAPQPGLVVYATSLGGSRMGGNDRQSPEIGLETRRNDRIIVLPDVSEMITELKVHESQAGRVYEGQRVRIVCDAIPDTTLNGTVVSVGVMAVGGSWRDPNRRDYTVQVKLDDTDGLGLKPSMRCKGEILLDRVEEALYVPIQAIFRQDGKALVYMPAGSGYAQREVKIGRPSESNTEVLDGLQQGDRVLLREPDDSEIVSRLDFTDEPGAQGDQFDDPDIPQRPADSSRPPMGNRGGQRGGDPSAMLSRLDKNGDGLLQRDEFSPEMQGMFDRFDKNSDGTIDAEEMASISGH